MVSRLTVKAKANATVRGPGKQQRRVGEGAAGARLMERGGRYRGETERPRFHQQHQETAYPGRCGQYLQLQLFPFEGNLLISWQTRNWPIVCPKSCQAERLYDNVRSFPTVGNANALAPSTLQLPYHGKTTQIFYLDTRSVRHSTTSISHNYSREKILPYKMWKAQQGNLKTLAVTEILSASFRAGLKWPSPTRPTQAQAAQLGTLLRAAREHSVLGVSGPANHCPLGRLSAPPPWPTAIVECRASPLNPHEALRPGPVDHPLQCGPAA